jgi:hypothetical protein
MMSKIVLFVVALEVYHSMGNLIIEYFFLQ